jgi:GT2 family glycosyltransferase
MSLLTRIGRTLVAKDIRGHLDQCNAAGLAGWVAAGDKAGERLQIEILADGVPVLRIVADAYREDLAAAGIGDGRHGFRASLPQHLCDGRAHTIEVRELSSGIALPGSPKTLQAAAAKREIRGSVDQCDATGVSGWVANYTSGERLQVEIFADGVPVLRIVADAYREDLATAGIGDGKHGFKTSLPQNLYDGRAHTIEIREVSTGTLLWGPNALSNAPKAVIYLDPVVGHTVYGWSIAGQELPPEITLGFEGKLLGKLTPSLDRPDVKDALGLESSNVGFVLRLGGLLHFSALSAKMNTLRFKQAGPGGEAKELHLPPHYPEAFTFAPLKALSRPMEFPAPGVMRGARCFGDSSFSMMLDVGSQTINGMSRVHVDFYQEQDAGSLQAVGQFDVELAGQLTNLDFQLLASDRPVLIVFTDGDRNLLVTDCIPCPEIFLERYAPLVEYHCLLYSGQRFFDVAAKISRSFLDFHLSRALGEIEEPANKPHRDNTAVLLFVRGDYDAFPSLDAEHYRHVSQMVSFLGRDGLVQGTNGVKSALTVERWIAGSDAEFFLLCEVGNSIRPDFWSVVHGHNDRFCSKPALVYWDSIWLDGVSRPYWVKSQMLLHDAFSRQSLSPINALIVGKALLSQAVALQREKFRSGALRPENAFCFAAPEATSRLPVVMDIRRLGITPERQQLLVDEQSALVTLDRLATMDELDASDKLPGPRSPVEPGKSGASVVINYRNLADATIRCLQSIRLQRVNAPIEVILVNNGSDSSSVKSVKEAATTLFGKPNVKTIDYDQRFNHSAQCNLAVAEATHDLILMLSNDAVLISADAISQAIGLTTIPWVATCGFRHVGIRNKKPVLISMGLALTQSKYLFSGSSPIVTNHLMPHFMLDCTVSTVGNTFAAVMLRKSVYKELQGLDEELFPHNYNDVDFCFRASARGYRHVVAGGCLVGHMGRGSREMDLDLPINERIVERIPPLSVLTNTFSIVEL